MSQVMYSMRKRLPDVDALLKEIGATRRQLPSVSKDEAQALTDRLDRLCVGADPDEAIKRLRAFQEAVQTGNGLQAAQFWVRVMPYLRAKGA